MGRQISDDVVRSSDATEEVQVETSDISNKFKFFETYKDRGPETKRKQFRITPPRDGENKVRRKEKKNFSFRAVNLKQLEKPLNKILTKYLHNIVALLY